MGELALWPGQIPNLPLRFILPVLRQDEALGRLLFMAALRAWKQDGK